MVEQWPYTCLDAATDHFDRNEDCILWERVQLDGWIGYQLFTLRWPSWINNGDTKYKHADDTLPFCNNRILYNPSIGPSDIQSVSNMWVKNTLSKSGGLNKWGAKMASSGISYKQSVLTYNHRHYNYDLGTKNQWQNAIAQNPSTKNACPNP